MPCDNCVRLTRELREAREELSEYRAPDTQPDPAKLLRWLRKPASPQTAYLLLHLAQRPGRVCEIMDLADAMNAADTMNPRNCVRVHVARARRCLEFRGAPDAIFNLYGVGFGLDRATAAMIMEAAL